MKARSASTCPVCSGGVRLNDVIVKTFKGWVHPQCAEFERNKARINAGETYRSQAPSTWTRKPRMPRGMT